MSQRNMKFALAERLLLFIASGSGSGEIGYTICEGSIRLGVNKDKLWKVLNELHSKKLVRYRVVGWYAKYKHVEVTDKGKELVKSLLRGRSECPICNKGELVFVKEFVSKLKYDYCGVKWMGWVL